MNVYRIEIQGKTGPMQVDYACSREEVQTTLFNYLEHNDNDVRISTVKYKVEEVRSALESALAYYMHDQEFKTHLEKELYDFLGEPSDKDFEYQIAAFLQYLTDSEKAQR